MRAKTTKAKGVHRWYSCWGGRHGILAGSRGLGIIKKSRRVRGEHHPATYYTSLQHKVSSLLCPPPPPPLLDIAAQQSVKEGCEGTRVGKYRHVQGVLDVFPREGDFWRGSGRQSWKRCIHSVIQQTFNAYYRLFSALGSRDRKKKQTGFSLRESGKESKMKT